MVRNLPNWPSVLLTHEIHASPALHLRHESTKLTPASSEARAFIRRAKMCVVAPARKREREKGIFEAKIWLPNYYRTPYILAWHTDKNLAQKALVIDPPRKSHRANELTKKKRLVHAQTLLAFHHPPFFSIIFLDLEHRSVPFLFSFRSQLVILADTGTICLQKQKEKTHTSIAF